MFEDQVVIFDIGSLNTRIGIAGDDEPLKKEPTLIGKKRKGEIGCEFEKERYFGKEAFSKRENLDLAYPIRKKKITDQIEYELYLEKQMEWIEMDTSQLHFLFAEDTLNCKASRHRLCEIIFEKYNAESFYLANEACLAVYASGRSSGMAIDSGYQVTIATPVYEGYALRNLSNRIEIGGNHSSLYLMNRLMNKGIFSEQLDLNLMREIKKEIAHVSLDFDKELERSNDEKEYELPDGKILKFGAERFECAELLFQPSLIQSDSLPIHQLVNDCIFKNCEKDLLDNFANNIVLCGGNSLLKDFGLRLRNELIKSNPNHPKIRMIEEDYREKGVWIGGSIIASLGTFKGYSLKKSKYNEIGPTVAHQYFY